MHLTLCALLFTSVYTSKALPKVNFNTNIKQCFVQYYFTVTSILNAPIRTKNNLNHSRIHMGNLKSWGYNIRWNLR